MYKPHVKKKLDIETNASLYIGSRFDNRESTKKVSMIRWNWLMKNIINARYKNVYLLEVQVNHSNVGLESAGSKA